ncbi:hypothetical protein [Mycobacterium angelicum]|nr:hypothetical protein [Mycobacterium angelicum]
MIRAETAGIDNLREVGLGHHPAVVAAENKYAVPLAGIEVT